MKKLSTLRMVSMLLCSLLPFACVASIARASRSPADGFDKKLAYRMYHEMDSGLEKGRSTKAVEFFAGTVDLTANDGSKTVTRSALANRLRNWTTMYPVEGARTRIKDFDHWLADYATVSVIKRISLRLAHGARTEKETIWELYADDWQKTNAGWRITGTTAFISGYLNSPPLPHDVVHWFSRQNPVFKVRH